MSFHLENINLIRKWYSRVWFISSLVYFKFHAPLHAPLFHCYVTLWGALGKSEKSGGKAHSVGMATEAVGNPSRLEINETWLYKDLLLYSPSTTQHNIFFQIPIFVKFRVGDGLCISNMSFHLENINLISEFLKLFVYKIPNFLKLCLKLGVRNYITAM